MVDIHFHFFGDKNSKERDTWKLVENICMFTELQYLGCRTLKYVLCYYYFLSVFIFERQTQRERGRHREEDTESEAGSRR